MRRRIIDPLEYYKEHFSGLTPSEVKQKDLTLYSRLVKAGLTKELPRKDGKLPIEIRMKLNEFFLEDGYRDPTFYLPEIRFRTGKDGKKHVCTFYIDDRRHSLKPSFGLPYTDVELKRLFFDGEFGCILAAYTTNNEFIKSWRVNPDGKRLLSTIPIITSSNPDNPYKIEPKVKELNNLRNFLTAGFNDRDSNLEPMVRRSNKTGVIYLCSFSSDGKEYTARVYIGKPDTDVQIRTVYFHNDYGKLLGVYECSNGLRKKLLRAYRVDMLKESCLQSPMPDELFPKGQRVTDSRYGRGTICDVYTSKENLYVKVEFESTNSGIVHYPFERALEMLSTV